MKQISLPVERMKERYRVVIVGSGYGGGVAAARIAQVQKNKGNISVCLLERGKELHPGEYPNTFRDTLLEMQVNLPNGARLGPSTGLYDFHINKDISVVVGCGLGGTSLINANACLRLPPMVMEDKKFWPQKLLDEFKDDNLDKWYEKAERMLKPKPYPWSFRAPLKTQAFDNTFGAIWQSFGNRVERPKLAVTFGKNEADEEARDNGWGVQQKPCIQCGDCVSGCNYWAKNTVLMNYLPAAEQAGAEIYTQASVLWIEQKGQSWRVHYRVLGGVNEELDADPKVVEADYVILAAGTLGSTEILLRSREKGLPLSNELGYHFSGNGDALRFSRSTEEVNGIGSGDQPVNSSKRVGPCITSMITLPTTRNQTLLIQEGSIPGALSPLLPLLLAFEEALQKPERDRGKDRVLDPLLQKAKAWDRLKAAEYEKEARHLQTYLVMGDDGAGGRMELENDRVRIHWPDIKVRPLFDPAEKYLREAIQTLEGGRYIEGPVWRTLTKWSRLTNSEVLTVHPLGGCIMADDARCGVVNHKGQAFSGISGEEVYDTLYVCDGSIIPRALGVNPLLTITALAERCCSLLVDEL
jgi:cholesterol oxidase